MNQYYTRELAKQHAELLNAYANGIIIQWQFKKHNQNGEWHNVIYTPEIPGNLNFDTDMYNWRIKPTPRRFWVVTTKYTGNVVFITLESATDFAEANAGTIIPVIEILN